MTIYNIHIDYTTGNSFGSERITDEPLGIVTTDSDKAKENLKRIKGHYLKYKDDSSCSNDKYQLKLLTDEEPRIISPFWLGYFETLHGAKIVADEDSEYSFTF